MDIKSIATGAKNLIVAKPEIETMARERMQHCNGCKHNRYGQCRQCGCVLAMKVRSSVEHCPLNYWHAKV